VLFVGILLTIIGWALVVPRGGGSGSVAHRNVRMGTMFFQTRGYSELTDEQQFRSARLVRIIGAVVMAIGLLLLFFST
jgi:hypothetical protein